MWFWYTMGRLNEGHSTCFIWNPNQKIYEIYFRLADGTTERSIASRLYSTIVNLFLLVQQHNRSDRFSKCFEKMTSKNRYLSLTPFPTQNNSFYYFLKIVVEDVIPESRSLAVKDHPSNFLPYTLQFYLNQIEERWVIKSNHLWYSTRGWIPNERDAKNPKLI